VGRKVLPEGVPQGTKSDCLEQKHDNHVRNLHRTGCSLEQSRYEFRLRASLDTKTETTKPERMRRAFYFSLRIPDSHSQRPAMLYSKQHE